MALQVWLPLTQDTRNQGLLNLPTPWDARSRDTGGKLGQYCYSDNAIYHINNEWLGNTWSLACWVKSSGWSQYNDIMLAKNATESTAAQFYLSIIGGTQLNIGCNAGSQTLTVNYTFATNTWYHIASTYDGNTLKLYLNGNEIGTKAYVSTQTAGMNNLGIGCRSTNAAGTSATGGASKRMNDIRIYDNCLSPEEVKKIAQGLVLHYPLNHSGCGNENLAKNSLVNISTTAYNTANFNLSEEIVEGASYTVTLKGSLGQGKSYYGIWMGGGYTGLGPFTDNNDGTFTKHFTGPSSVAGSGSRTQINIYAVPSSNTDTCTLEWLKIEKGDNATPWCPNSSDIGGNIEYDISGYCYNGTRVGNITWSTDTPKYQVSTNFPNNCNTYIFNTEVPKLTKDLTFACWCKVASIGTGYSFIISQGRDNTADGFNLALLGSTFILRGSFGTVDSNIATDNTWTHIVGTYDGTVIKIYINGELKNSLSYTADLTYTYAPAFVVGKMAYDYTSSIYYFPINGNISDVRVYATALSAEDVQALYQAKNISD